MDTKSERPRTLAWYPIFAVGLSMVSFILVKTGRDAVFFDPRGLERLPQAYMWIALASIPAAYFNLQFMRRFGARATRTGTFVVTALMLFGFVPWTDRSHGTALTTLFVLVPVAYAAVFAGAWLLAGDLLDGADRATTRRAYTAIGIGSMLGGIAGGMLAKALALAVTPKLLIAAGAAVLLGVAVLVATGHRRRPVEAGSSERMSDSSDAIPIGAAGSSVSDKPLQPGLLHQPYVRALIGISTVSSAIALLIDFQFYAIATIGGHSGMQFFANFYIALNLCSLALQWLVAPRLQARFGIGGALLVLPLALLGGAGVVTLSTSVLGRSLLKVTEGGLKSSVFRSIWEQLFLQVDKARRGVAKMLVDGLSARIAEGVGAVALYVWLLRNPTTEQQAANLGYISWIILGLTLVWIRITRHLKSLGCEIGPDDGDWMIRLPDA